MAPDTPAATAGPALDHCPQCRGAVRPGAPWCTQCWTDLRPAPAPEPSPVPVAPPVAEPPAPAVAPAPVASPAGTGDDVRPASAPGGWPCPTCSHVNAFEHDACLACGTSFVAALRSGEAPLLTVPGVGDITRLSRAQRLGLGAAVAVAMALVVLLLGVLFG